MKTLKNTFRYIMLSLKYNLKSAMEYKKSFFIQSIFMIINNLFFIIYWILIFSVNDGEVNGITFKEIMLLWAMPNGAWGIANFIFGGLRDIDRLVISGGLDTYLLQPKNIIISIAFSKSRYTSFGDLVFGIVMAIIAAESWAEFFGVLAFMILGAIVMMACFIVVRSFSVIIGDMENIASVYENSLLITLSTYPYNIFGDFMRVIMFTVVPTAFIVHLPIKIICNFDFRLTVLECIVPIILFLFSAKFFDFMLKKYESGNNIAMKE